MTDLEYFIKGINKDHKKAAREIRRENARSLPVTIKDFVLDARDGLMIYIHSKQDERQFQKFATADYQKYLSMHDESKIDTIDSYKFDNGVAYVIHTDQGPLVKTERFSKVPDNVKIYSEVQATLGAFDRQITFEGFCYSKDKKGDPQLMYAQVTNTVYKGAEGTGTFDPGKSYFEGYKRLPSGKFVRIDEEHIVGEAGEQMFEHLQKMFDYKWNLLRPQSTSNNQSTNERSEEGHEPKE